MTKPIIFNSSVLHLKRVQLLSLEFSEIDLFLLYLTCGRDRGRTVSAQLRVSYQNITPSIQNFTSGIESFWVDAQTGSRFDIFKHDSSNKVMFEKNILKKDY